MSLSYLYILPKFTINFLPSDNAASPHFATYHEGSLQVPIPCAVVNVVIITVLIIALISLSGGSAFNKFMESAAHKFIESFCCKHSCPVEINRNCLVQLIRSSD